MKPAASSPGVVAKDSEAGGSSRLSRRTFLLVERVLLVGGIVLLAVLIQQIGAGTVWRDVWSVGYGLIFIVGQELFAYIANACGWYCAFSTPRPVVPFRDLLAARIAGDAINGLTPTATVGGEFVRARFLQDRVETTTIWASLAVARVLQSVAQAVFIIVGLLIILDDTPMPDGMRRGLFAGLALFSALLISAVAAQRRGLLVMGGNLLRRLGLRIGPRVDEQLRRLDQEIARFYENPIAFLSSTAAFLVGWMMGILEIYLILVFLSVPGASWHLALTVEVLSVAIDALFFLVPAKAGTQEGGKVLIFTILGLPPAKGLALGLVRRVRDLSWSAIGLVILSRYHLRKGVRGLG